MIAGRRECQREFLVERKEKECMAQIDYGALKKGGFMRQKQKGYFSLRLQVVGGNLTAENITFQLFFYCL